MDLVKFDEIDTLLLGMAFFVENVPDEMYFYKGFNFSDGAEPTKVPVKVPVKGGEGVGGGGGGKGGEEGEEGKEGGKGTETTHMGDAGMNAPSATTYPFLVANIGSGVSFCRVDGPDDNERVGGTNLGGGTSTMKHTPVCLCVQCVYNVCAVLFTVCT